ncbi:hypothetical protein G3567_00620 [Psychroflexus sp. YR1-1]|uniref:Uncharacterized protein n=1 Tax=Psychroflexus aurantiacus TaxID=2709310 RepID=A0A6B3QYA8_9FLAO|nr:hypothetical protein [Psychroflexus aurantiacus]NEV92648.1 hypothetical protein [Psychroflexus aurantiacus]
MKNSIKHAFILVLMLVVISTEAQTFEEIIGFEDSVSDTNAAPIYYLIPIAIAIGVVLGIKKLK